MRVLIKFSARSSAHFSYISFTFICVKKSNHFMPISDVIKRRRKNTQKISWEIFHAWISEENNNLVKFTYKANNWWLKMIAEFPKTLRQCKIHLVDDVERDWNCRVKRNILIDPSTPPIFEHIQWKFHFHASAFFNKISKLLNFSCWCDGDDDDRLLCDVYTHFHDIEEILFLLHHHHRLGVFLWACLHFFFHSVSMNLWDVERLLMIFMTCHRVSGEDC